MCVNPLKCTSNAKSNKFLKIFITPESIKMSSSKVKVILNMASLRKTKDEQQVIKQVVRLNKFISKASQSCLPIFTVVRYILGKKSLIDECHQPRDTT